MSIQIDWRQEAGISIVQASGRIDGVQAPAFRGALERGLEGESGKSEKWVLDFGRVTYIASAGLRVILSIAKRLRGQGAELALCSLSPAVHEVFAVSGFDNIIDIHASLKEAIRGADDSEDALPSGGKHPFDQDIVEDNLRDIAAFVIEKYEYRNDLSLPKETRANVQEAVEKALWKRVDVLQRHRQRILRNMFALAESTLKEALGDEG